MFDDRFREVSPGVYHAKSWGITLTSKDVEALIDKAKANPLGRARLCLHPSPDDVEQQMLIALTDQVPDPIHKHPSKREAILPVYGVAHHICYDDSGNTISRTRLESSAAIYCSSPLNTYHHLELETGVFVFWEFALGPFDTNATTRRT